MTTAEIIKRIRTDLKLDQKQMAEKIGISQSAVSQYEGGKRNIAIETLVEWCGKLNYPLKKIFKI